MGLDLWRIYSDRAGMAAAVDAAAEAGAAQIDEDAFRAGTIALDPGRAEDAARDNLAGQSDAGRFTAADIVAEPQRITVRGEGFVQLTLLRIHRAGTDPSGGDGGGRAPSLTMRARNA